MLPADANGLTQATWHWLVLITELLDHSRFHVRNEVYTVIYTKVTTFLFSQASRILHNKQLAWKNHPVLQDLSISTCVAYFVYGPPHKQVLRLARHPSITPRLTTIAFWRISPIWRLQQTERDLLTLHLRENRLTKFGNRYTTCTLTDWTGRLHWETSAKPWSTMSDGSSLTATRS